MAEKILRDLYCYLCSLQFDGKKVYDMHQATMHNYENEVSSIQNIIKTEFNEEGTPITVDVTLTNSLNMNSNSVDKSKKSNFVAKNHPTEEIAGKLKLKRQTDSINEVKKSFKCELS